MSAAKSVLALGLAALAMAAPGTALAQCAASTSLTGKWKGDDGGTYRVRAVGNEVWWIGTSADGGKSWTNVFKGNRVGNQISGRWADIAGPMGNGTLTLVISSNALIKRTAGTGGFGGTKWGRAVGCDDVILNPVEG